MSNQNYNANVHFTTPAGWELGLHQILNLTSTTEVALTQTSNIHWWGPFEQGGLLVLNSECKKHRQVA